MLNAICCVKGFTLVELLVVMIILGTVGAIIGSILFSALRGASKANVLQVVRQNGNYAISQIGKTIRNAKQVSGVDCLVIPPTPTPQPTPSISLSIIVTELDGIQKTIFVCDNNTITIANSGNPSTPPTPLLDTSAVTIPAASSTLPNPCSFTCTKNSTTDMPKITIQFTLSQAGNGVFAEQNASLTFETSIAVRNSQQ